MKNVHVLPTEKASTLSIIDSELVFSKEYFINPQHIYITSDEEIKEGDWCFYLGRFGAKIVCKAKLTDTGFVYQEFGEDYVGREDEGITPLKSEIFKIILTTDQDLINEGVQAIDDEFLEWFVKNPSCKSVVVELKNDWNLEKGLTMPNFFYKIIIPQEEPKQEWKPKEGEEVWIKVFSNWSSGKYIGYDVDKKVHLVREPEEGGGHLFSSPYILPYSALPNEPKKETIEEAADNWVRQPVIGTKRESFIKGAEWQAERMYSLADLEVAFFEGRKKNSTFVELFEQFKNK